MTQRKKRIVLAVLALLSLPLICLILIRQQILSPTEEALVGLWYYDVADNPALTWHNRVLMELRGNHRCFLREINHITGDEVTSYDGWWNVHDGLLRLDWRGKWGGLSPLELSANGSIQTKQSYDDNEIVEINDDGMIVLPRYPRNPFTWKRVKE
jgi:hypothetical protein